MQQNTMIVLKYEHSIRVADICGRIADSLSWRDVEREAARTMGLLHDVGRFAQYSRFRTFSDQRSEDHGEAGYEFVSSSNLLDRYDHTLSTAILTGIRFHNRREIPSGIADADLDFLKLIRDADKLDIYGIFDEAIRDDSFASRLQSALDIDIDGPVNPRAVEDVLNNETVANDHIKSGMDFLVMLLSWIFDLNFAPSKKMLAESGTIELVMGRLPRGDGVDRAVEHVRERFAGMVDG